MAQKSGRERRGRMGKLDEGEKNGSAVEATSASLGCWLVGIKQRTNYIFGSRYTSMVDFVVDWWA